MTIRRERPEGKDPHTEPNPGGTCPFHGWVYTSLKVLENDLKWSKWELRVLWIPIVILIILRVLK